MLLLKFFFSSRFWLCYLRTHSFQLRFSPELKGFQVAGFFLAQLLLWKWFLLFIWSCEGKWSVIDCNSRLKTMFVCLLLLKVWNVVSICPQVTSLINDLCVASLNYQAGDRNSCWEMEKYDLDTQMNCIKYLLNAMKCTKKYSWLVY